MGLPVVQAEPLKPVSHWFKIRIDCQAMIPDTLSKVICVAPCPYPAVQLATWGVPPCPRYVPSPLAQRKPLWPLQPLAPPLKFSCVALAPCPRRTRCPPGKRTPLERLNVPAPSTTTPPLE